MSATVDAQALVDSTAAPADAPVETLDDRLVARLLASPIASLVTADDDEGIETALALFGREGRGDETDGRTANGESDAAAATIGD